MTHGGYSHFFQFQMRFRRLSFRSPIRRRQQGPSDACRFCTFRGWSFRPIHVLRQWHCKSVTPFGVTSELENMIHVYFFGVSFHMLPLEVWTRRCILHISLFILNEWMVDLLYLIPCALCVVVIHIVSAILLDEKRKFSPSTFVDLFPSETVTRCQIYRGTSGGMTNWLSWFAMTW